MRVSYERACVVTSMVTAELLREVGPVEAMARCAKALAAEGWTLTELCAEAERRMKERIAAMRRCACGHSDERHVECVDFTSAQGCFEEDCTCQKYRPVGV